MARQEVKTELPLDLLKYLIVLIGAIILVVYGIAFIELGVRDIEIILSFIAIGAISRFPQRMLGSHYSIGIELVTLVTVVSAILYSPVVGLIVGVLSVGISAFFTIEPIPDIVVMIPAFALVGYFASPVYSYFGDLGLAALAITALYDLGTGLIYLFLGHSIIGTVRFSIMHIPSNYLFLKYLGPKLIGF